MKAFWIKLFLLADSLGVCCFSFCPFFICLISLCCDCDILFRVAVSEQQFRMMNYGLEEKAGLFWNHYSAPSAVTKEFQNDSFSIICVKKREKEEKDGKAKGGWEGKRERNWGRKEQMEEYFSSSEHWETLHSLMSFPYQTSQFWNPYEFSVVLTKVVPWTYCELLTGVQVARHLWGLQKAVLLYPKHRTVK